LNSQIHIFSEKKSNRLVYILSEVFERRLQLTPVLYRDANEYSEVAGLKINYSNLDLPGLQIKPAVLLFERRIDDHDLSTFMERGILKLFKSSSVLGYDPLAAAFYFLSRYEEYLPHREDEHGRYKAEESVVVQNQCHQLPLVEIYCEELRHELGLEKSLPSIETELITVDVDQVFAFKAKGLARTIAGTLKSLLKSTNSFSKRLSVLIGQDSDPLDIYDDLIEDFQNTGTSSIFFFQVGEASSHDINNPPHLSLVKQRINDVAMKARIGLHPSYHTPQSHEMLQLEVERLKAITSIPVTQSRQHYLKFKIPETFKWLKEAGVEKEYSMAYSTINGFRASTCKPFEFFDLRADDRIEMEMMPTCWMDMTAVRNHIRVEDAMAELLELRKTVHTYGGHFITTWHPDSLIGMNVEYSTLPLLHQLIGKDEI
jgi:hypothetical protein